MENTTHEGAPNGEGQNQEQQSVSIEEFNKLKASNERLLRESKEYKAKYSNTLTEAEEKERALAEKSKDNEKLLMLERRRLAELQNKLKSLSEATRVANIKATLAKVAPDAVDIDDLMMQPKFENLLKSGIDEETNTLSEDIAKVYVAEVFKAKPYLKKNGQRSATVNGVPGKSGFTVGEEDLAKKSNSDLVAMMFQGLT